MKPAAAPSRPPPIHPSAPPGDGEAAPPSLPPLLRCGAGALVHASSRRALLQATAGLALSGAVPVALGQQAPAPGSRPAARQSTEPLPLPPPPAPGPPDEFPSQHDRSLGDPAPIPNRDMEAPRPPGSDVPRTEFSPGFINPRSESRGQTFGPEHMPSDEDRLFRDPAPGATVKIPFAY